VVKPSVSESGRWGFMVTTSPKRVTFFVENERAAISELEGKTLQIEGCEPFAVCGWSRSKRREAPRIERGKRWNTGRVVAENHGPWGIRNRGIRDQTLKEACGIQTEPQISGGTAQKKSLRPKRGFLKGGFLIGRKKRRKKRP